MLPNQNLLDNPDFSINQRGEEEYTEIGRYAMDRWILVGDNSYITWNVKIVDGGISIAQGSAISQKLDITESIEGQVVALSVLIDDEIYSITTIWDSNIAYASALKENGFRIGWSGQGKYIQIYNENGSASALIKVAKLELGTHQTLAHKEGDTWVLNDPPPNKALELAKCQRYQFVLSSWIRINSSRVSKDFLDFFVPLPVSPRIAPAITFTNTSLREIETDTGIDTTGFSVRWCTAIGNGLQLRIEKVNHGIKSCILEFGSGYIFDFNL